MQNRGSIAVIFFSLLSILCSVSFASGKESIPFDLRLVLAEAQRAINKKSYRKAEKIIGDYLEKESVKPHHLAYYLLGNAYYLENKTEDAYRAYLNAYKLNSSYRPVCVNLAKVCYDLRKYREAGDFFLQAYAVSKKPDPEFLYESGVSYFQGKLYRKAKSVLKRLMRGNKEIKEAWLRLFVFTCVELKEWDTAEKSLFSLLRKKKTNVTYWKLLAQLKLQKGDYKGAASALEIAYRLRPPSAKGWKDLANIYFYIGIPLKAARCLEKAYVNDPSPRELDEIARAYAQTCHFERAVAYYQRAATKKPTSTRWLEIAKLYYRNGMWKKGIVALKKSISLNPGDGLAYLLLGYCAWQADDKALAIRSFDSASRYKRYRDQALTALELIKENEGR